MVRVAVTLEMGAGLFRTDAYLNAVSPTPFHSFLTANYKARAGSKCWRRHSRHASFKRPRSNSDGTSDCKKLDLERAFNKVMDRERMVRDSKSKDYFCSEEV